MQGTKNASGTKRAFRAAQDKEIDSAIRRKASDMHTIINSCTGIRIAVRRGQKIEITDIEGGQVIDFFTEMQSGADEFLSPGVTIDCNASLRIWIGDLLYSNKYRPMLCILYDDVGEHDLLHPCCRPEMYDFFYHNGEGHPNCLDNINKTLGKTRSILLPVNLFMHTRINADGSIKVCKPLSKANDKIVLEALEDMHLGIAACSVSESTCNGGAPVPPFRLRWSYA